MLNKLTRGRSLRIAAVGVSAALLVGLAGCSGGEGGSDAGSGDGKTLKVWWYESADSAMGQSWQQALTAFQADHPGVTVDFEQKTYEQFQKSGQMVLNSNDVPDVLEYPKGNATAGTVASAGLLTNLNDVAAERGWDTTLPPSVLTVGKYDSTGLMGTGDLYGVPTYGEYVSVFYNKDLFAKHNLTTPTSVDQLETVMKTFTDNGVTPLALGSNDYPIVHLIYELALNKADPQWLKNFQFFDGDVDFHDTAWTYAAKTAADWVKKGYISTDSTGIDAASAATAFEAGTYPMMVSGSWFDGEFKTKITTFQWSTFAFPGNTMTAGSGGNIFVVPTNAKNKTLAYDFIDKTLSTPVQTAMGNLGGVPIAADTSAVTDPIGKLASSDFATIVKNDGLAYYPDWPVTGYYDILLAQSQNLVTGSSSPTQFLDAIGQAYATGKKDAGH